MQTRKSGEREEKEKKITDGKARGPKEHGEKEKEDERKGEAIIESKASGRATSSIVEIVLDLQMREVADRFVGGEVVWGVRWIGVAELVGCEIDGGGRKW